MTVCASCGHENRDEARFCDACGALLAAQAPERRKLATLLFCDMSGSTALGERVDAESVREMMFSYFHEMRGAIERHGGTVEKFIGDAVMAVFGVPTGHEDDALRACRAAFEMRERLGALNEELGRRYGSKIALRIGVNTGEVVAGDATARQALVTGDAVNVAARLEQAAAPGEILIGEPTFRLVRDAVSAEAVEPLTLKGKSEPMAAYRLTHVEQAAPARVRRLDAPMVGRDGELELLRSTLAEAKAGRPMLATIVGEPGVGKSRLAAELLGEAQADFLILSGRCLEYGEGITYWPIAEIVRQAAGVRDEHSREEAVQRIESLLPRDNARVVGQAIGLTEGQASTQEIAVAIQSLVGTLARRRPVILFVDDIHWAEPALLELLAALPVHAEEAPMLLLCLARPELLESETQWTATIRLQPLEHNDSTKLVVQLLGDAALPAELAERISSAAAGNPLFVEELVGMLVDDGLVVRRNGGWVADPNLASFTIPPTLRELLGARLDRMAQGERSTLERGAVEGQVFHRGAVLVLSEAEQRSEVPDSLQALVEREYLRPAAASFADEGAFRIRHILIRDAAYEGIPKKLRASLHERYADWLEEKTGERASEYEEILGYHLEQAYRYRAELGSTTDYDRDLALRAAGRLERAGRRALDRRDSPATVNLLSRAVELLPEASERRLELQLFVGEELGYMMSLEAATAALDEVREGATALGNRRLAGRARVVGGLMRFWSDPDFGVEEYLAEIDEVAADVDDAEESVVARAHDARALVYVHMGRFEAAQKEAEQAIELFRGLGDRRLTVEQFWYLGWAAASGPVPVEDGIERCRRILEEAADDAAVNGHIRYSLASLEAKRGHFDEARELADQALAIFEDTGMVFTVWHPLYRGEIELLAGDMQAAEEQLRRSLYPLEAVFDLPSLANAANLLAGVLVDQDRIDEAEELTSRAEAWAPKDQPIQHARWRAARARVLARREDSAAESLAREAIELAAQTDFLELQGDCRVALADVLRLTGRHEQAAETLEEAFRLYEQKGNVVSSEKVRALLASSKL